MIELVLSTKQTKPVTAGPFVNKRVSSRDLSSIPRDLPSFGGVVGRLPRPF